MNSVAGPSLPSLNQGAGGELSSRADIPLSLISESLKGNINQIYNSIKDQAKMNSLALVLDAIYCVISNPDLDSENNVNVELPNGSCLVLMQENERVLFSLDPETVILEQISFDTMTVELVRIAKDNPTLFAHTKVTDDINQAELGVAELAQAMTTASLSTPELAKADAENTFAQAVDQTHLAFAMAASLPETEDDADLAKAITDSLADAADHASLAYALKQSTRQNQETPPASVSGTSANSAIFPAHPGNTQPLEEIEEIHNKIDLIRAANPSMSQPCYMVAEYLRSGSPNPTTFTLPHDAATVLRQGEQYDFGIIFSGEARKIKVGELHLTEYTTSLNKKNLLLNAPESNIRTNIAQLETHIRAIYPNGCIIRLGQSGSGHYCYYDAARDVLYSNGAAAYHQGASGISLTEYITKTFTTEAANTIACTDHSAQDIDLLEKEYLQHLGISQAEKNAWN